MAMDYKPGFIESEAEQILALTLPVAVGLLLHLV